MATNGNDIFVLAGSNVIAGTRSNDIQVACDELEISSPGQGEWYNCLAGRKKWSITTNYLVVAANSALSVSGGNGVKDLLQVGNTFTLKIKRRGQSTHDLSGNAMLKTCRITANRGNLVQGSFEFVGKGSLA